MEFRIVTDADYHVISSVINEWWGGRPMSGMLPKLFFIHFRETSFIAEENGKIMGFIIGFISQTYPNEAYIHFVGIHPDDRQRGLGRKLYTLFFDAVRKKGCEIVRCITSPVNKSSIKFHTKMGFDMEQGDQTVEGIPFVKDYDGVGGDRVLFRKRIGS